MAMGMKPSQLDYLQQTFVGGLAGPMAGEVGEACITDSCPIRPEQLDAQYLKSAKVITAPTGPQCFVSVNYNAPETLYAADPNHYTPAMFVEPYYKDPVIIEGYQQEGSSNEQATLDTGGHHNRMIIRMSMPRKYVEHPTQKLKDGSPAFYEQQVKEVDDVFEVYTLGQCKAPTVEYCNCGSCDDCCATPETRFRRYPSPICLGTVRPCNCMSGECSCDGSLIIKPNFPMTGLFVALCAYNSGETYHIEATAQTYYCDGC